MCEKNNVSPYVGQLSKINISSLNLSGAVVLCKTDENFTIIEADDKYFQLIGYTREEVYSIFGNSGKALVYEDDLLEKTQSLLFEVHAGVNPDFSIVTKVKNKYRGFKEIYLDGKTFFDEERNEQLMSMYVTEANEDLSISDVPDARTYAAIINSLTDDEYFSVNLINKTARFSQKFADIFGIDEIMGDFPNSLVQAGIVEKDALQELEIDHCIPSRITKQKDCYLIAKDGSHRWYRVYYMIVGNTKGEAVRIVGKCSDITKQKNQINNLTERAEKDQLTGLYNKLTTERLIKETLKNRRVNDGKFALFIIDIDNFKSINDNLGHQYGDEVLTQISENIRSIFRDDDVIGRIGGDEFFVFLRTYGEIKDLERKATEICNRLRTTHGKLNIPIAASVGIATCPEHGMTFNELYQKADMALYATKESGKDGYAIFNENLNLIDGEEYYMENTRHKPLHNSKNLKEGFTEYIFKLINSQHSQETAIYNMLKVLGQKFDFTRSGIFERDGESDVFTNTFEWNSIKCEHAEDSQKLPAYKIDDLLIGLEKNDLYLINSVANLPPSEEKRNYQSKGIKSLICFAVKDGEKVNAFIRFADCKKERNFPINEIEGLSTIFFFVGAYLKSFRYSQVQSNEGEVLLGFLGNIQNGVYAIDKNSNEVLFENETIKNITGKNSVGEKCYKAYTGKNSPCENCPVSPTYTGGKAVDLKNHWLGENINIYMATKEWKDNKKAVLLSCKNI